MFLILMELCVFALFVGFIITQVWKPIQKDTQWFPMFRREQKLVNEIHEVNQKIVEKSLENEIKKLKKEKGVK